MKGRWYKCAKCRLFKFTFISTWDCSHGCHFQEPILYCVLTREQWHGKRFQAMTYSWTMIKPRYVILQCNKWIFIPHYDIYDEETGSPLSIQYSPIYTPTTQHPDQTICLSGNAFGKNIQELNIWRQFRLLIVLYIEMAGCYMYHHPKVCFAWDLCRDKHI